MNLVVYFFFGQCYAMVIIPSSGVFVQTSKQVNASKLAEFIVYCVQRPVTKIILNAADITRSLTAVVFVSEWRMQISHKMLCKSRLTGFDELFCFSLDDPVSNPS